MCEIIWAWAIPVFDKHRAENCYHRDWRRFIDIKDFAIYCDKDDLKSCVQEMEKVYNNNELLHERRKSCFSIAKSHCDSEIVFNELLLLSKK